MSLKKVYDLDTERAARAEKFKREFLAWMEKNIDEWDDYVVLGTDGTVVDVFATESLSHFELLGVLDEAKESVRRAIDEEDE